MRIQKQLRKQQGFSLLEVLIAVVVLAVGLLAMASLLGKLSTNSADAKARSRIAALMTSVIDYQRAQGYNKISPILTTDPNPVTTTFQCVTTSPTPLQSAICTAQSDAAVSGITLMQTVTRYYATPAAGSFSTTAPGPTVMIFGDYKQIRIAANWKDATGSARNLVANTITSNLALNTSANILAQNITLSANMNPVVHETNPAKTDGVIPIAIGDNSNAASTNPKPTVSTSGANSTTFNTLNYAPDATGPLATIQKRVETEVAECVCQGQSTNPFGTNTLLGQNTFRPTYWNGTQYVPPAIVAGGVPRSSAATSVTQSEQCDICCRDHNDTGIAATEVRYDAVTGDTNRYKVNVSGNTVTTPVSLATSGSSAAPEVANVTNSTYLDACRFIRVDGLWRVATDIQATHMGLIATNDIHIQGTSTAPATPYAASQTLYQNFVIDAIKNYLASALPTAGSPAWLNFLTTTLAPLFKTYGPDVPSPNPVLADTNGTYRYLHAHGLYVDYLESEAIAKLNAVRSSSCTTTTIGYPKCLLAYLPFITINIGGLSSWEDTKDSSDQAGGSVLNTTVLSLGSGTSTSSTCANGISFGGCVTGLAGGYAYATSTIGHSNSGIAASIPVSPYEQLASNDLTAAQQFRVTAPSNPDLMYAQVYGPDLTPAGFSGVQQFPTAALNASINPRLTWSTGGSNGNCSVNPAKRATTPNPYRCNTTLTLSAPTTITVRGYNQSVANAATTAKDPCGIGGSSKNLTYKIPGLICYTLNTATLTTDAGTGAGGTARIDCNATPTPASCYKIASPFTVGGTSKSTTETTAVMISSVTGTPVALKNTYLNLTYTANGSKLGTIDTSTCQATGAPTITTPTSCN